MVNLRQQLGGRLRRRTYAFSGQRRFAQAHMAERAEISNEFMSAVERRHKGVFPVACSREGNVKRSWLEGEKSHRFLAESKLRAFLKDSFHKFRSGFSDEVSATRLASEILDYLACAQQPVRVKRGTRRFKTSSLEVTQRHDLEPEDVNELDSVVALIAHPNFILIGQWTDLVRSSASDFGLDWKETQVVLERFLKRHLGRLEVRSNEINSKSKMPKARGRPRRDDVASQVIELRKSGKSWTQVQLECNRLFDQDRTAGAYRQLAKSRRQAVQKSE